MSALALPGLTVTAEQLPPEETPLRTDVAGLLGRTRRGPLLQPMRVAGWRGFQRVYGDLVSSAHTPYAARGYFANGGEVAHIIRLAAATSATATAQLDLGTLDAHGKWAPPMPARADFSATSFRIDATSPGGWANGTQVELRYRSSGPLGTPEVDVRIQAPGEAVERFVRVAPRDLATALAASALVRFVPLGAEVPEGAATPAGPRSHIWRATLAHGGDDPPTLGDYQAAAQMVTDLFEVALIAAPDLYGDLSDPADAAAVVDALLELSAATHDRLVVLDVPPASAAPADAVQWANRLRGSTDEPAQVSGAAYHPPLIVPDPLGGTARPLRQVPSCGHVSGVISRLDRERGAYYSPANAPIDEAVDVASVLSEVEQASLNTGGVNVLRCGARWGLEVWGAHTLDPFPEGRFVAHRRLVHRVVRAIRRVADPLVFEGNRPELRLTFVRAITSVLLEAYNAGALQGDRPEEGFRVQCDDANNPPEQVDLGQLVCDIELAPAVPMEFIHIRLVLNTNGLLEVVERM